MADQSPVHQLDTLPPDQCETKDPLYCPIEKFIKLVPDNLFPIKGPFDESTIQAHSHLDLINLI